MKYICVQETVGASVLFKVFFKALIESSDDVSLLLLVTTLIFDLSQTTGLTHVQPRRRPSLEVPSEDTVPIA